MVCDITQIDAANGRGIRILRNRQNRPPVMVTELALKIFRFSSALPVSEMPLRSEVADILAMDSIVCVGDAKIL